jgi:hypothetical protein
VLSSKLIQNAEAFQTAGSSSIKVSLLGGGDERTDTPTGIPPERGARCVQSFDDSLAFAIRMTYRISLRSSSLWEPRHPLLKVLVFILSNGFFHKFIIK